MIYINGRFLTQIPTGVQRFAFELCKQLKKNGLEFKVLAPKKVLDTYKHNFDVIIIGQFQSHLWEQIELPVYLLRKNNPLLISFSGLGPVFYKRHISTIHDLAFYRNSEWFSFYYRTFYKIMTPILVRYVNKIITVSEFSKSEIINILRVPKEKITVVYNAVSFPSTSEVSKDKENYILAVSSIDPRKNFLALIKAFNSMNQPEYQLYIVGKKDRVFKDNDLGDFCSRNNIKFLGYISDKDLISYYKKASLFVYPSLYEGFGIPPIEAMSCGCPVLVSDIPVIREVCGDAAFYCNPYDYADIAAKMKQILSDKKNVINKINKGFEQIKQYNWEKSAQKVLALIKE